MVCLSFSRENADVKIDSEPLGNVHFSVPLSPLRLQPSALGASCCAVVYTNAPTTPVALVKRRKDFFDPARPCSGNDYLVSNLECVHARLWYRSFSRRACFSRCSGFACM